MDKFGSEIFAITSEGASNPWRGLDRLLYGKAPMPVTSSSKKTSTQQELWRPSKIAITAIGLAGHFAMFNKISIRRYESIIESNY